MPAVDIPEPGVIQDPAHQEDTDLPRLISYYEEAEQSQRIAREKAERDRDYVDNKQLTQDEIDKLTKRGQPPIALNVVRSRAAFLAGMEKKQRRDPKAYPRNNPEDVPAAEAFTDGMRYVVERGDYATKRSQAWKNITVEGFGGIELAAVPRAGGGMDFTIARIPWDRAFYDHHSAEPDFTDARYLGQVLWSDYDDALARAVQGGHVDEARAKEILDTCLAGSTSLGHGRTYDDKPHWQVWADGKRKRVRIVMMWVRETSGWTYYEFTKSGILLCSPGPYVDQDGETYCPWLFESANVDRENNRYGEIRHLIDPQDEINKRRSKALHLLNTTGVIADEGAVNDVNAARRELAKPDFFLLKNPGRQLEIVKGADLAAGQAQLGAQAMEYVMQAGPNAALLGKGTQDQSGKAIEAQQAGGLVEQSDLMDTLRRLDWRVFNVIASMMKQFWDSEQWIRVTDDDQTPKWVGLNVPMWTDPSTGETLPEHEWKRRIQQGQLPGTYLEPASSDNGEAMRHNDVARLDMDIMVSDAPDTISLDSQNYGSFIELMKMGLPPPVLKIAIEMNPALPAKRKKQLSDMIDQMGQQPPPPGAQEAEEIKKNLAEAKVVLTRAQAYAALATGEAALAKAGHFVATEPPLPSIAEGWGEPPMDADAPPALPPPGGPQGGPMPPQGPGPMPGPHPSMPPPQMAPGSGPPGPDAQPPGHGPVAQASMTRPGMAA